MKDEQLENAVVTLHASRGWSIRKISREVSLSRSRIRRILTSNNALRDASTEEGRAAEKRPRESKLDPFKDDIQELLARYPKITGQRLYEHLTQKGYAGGITICREYLRSVRVVADKIPIKMVETAPGQLAVHDWSDYHITFKTDGKAQKVIFFSYILGYSRRQYIAVVKDKTQPTMFRELIAAFTYLDGVPLEIRADNQKTCVDQWAPGAPVFNRKYLEFATWYRFTPKTITPYHPVQNLKIERPFWYLEENFLNARTFNDIEDLKSQLRQWLTQVNDIRIHGTTKKRPIDLYIEEHPYLQPLPRTHFDTTSLEHIVVNQESCIYWKGYQYVVPSKYMFDLCPVRITEDKMIVYAPTGEQIACHPLAEEGRKERYVGEHRKSPHKPDLSITNIIQRLQGFSPDMNDYIEQIKRHNPSTWRQHLRCILALRVNYRTEDIVIAIKRASDYKIFESGAIQTFLEKNSEPRYSIKLTFKPNSNE
jgi:transposase